MELISGDAPVCFPDPESIWLLPPELVDGVTVSLLPLLQTWLAIRDSLVEKQMNAVHLSITRGQDTTLR